MIFEKPSDKCGMCKKLGKSCFCRCHEFDLVFGYHEEINIMPTTGKAEDATKYENEIEIDYKTFKPKIC